MSRIKTLNRYRDQRGAALITALVLLVILSMLSLASMSTNTMEERMAANSQEKNRAFQAAESGLSLAFTNVDAFNVNNTEDNPVTGSVLDFGIYDADIDFEAAFRQVTPPRRGSGWDYNYALYHFDVSSTAVTPTGAYKNIHAGSYQVGRKR